VERRTAPSPCRLVVRAVLSVYRAQLGRDSLCRAGASGGGRAREERRAVADSAWARKSGSLSSADVSRPRASRWPCSITVPLAHDQEMQEVAASEQRGANRDAFRRSSARTSPRLTSLRLVAAVGSTSLRLEPITLLSVGSGSSTKKGRARAARSPRTRRSSPTEGDRGLAPAQRYSGASRCPEHCQLAQDWAASITDRPSSRRRRPRFDGVVVAVSPRGHAPAVEGRATACARQGISCWKEKARRRKRRTRRRARRRRGPSCAGSPPPAPLEGRSHSCRARLPSEKRMVELVCEPDRSWRSRCDSRSPSRRPGAGRRAVGRGPGW